jgi:hypothetical protein
LTIIFVRLTMPVLFPFVEILKRLQNNQHREMLPTDKYLSGQLPGSAVAGQLLLYITTIYYVAIIRLTKIGFENIQYIKIFIN